MSRIKFKKGKQKLFLNRIARHFDFDWAKMAKITNVCERELRDWRREKYRMSYEALLRLNKVSNVYIPRRLQVLPEYWSTKKAGKLGAIKRNELYGNPGTAEGRRKGGLTSSRKFRQDPEFAKKLGFKLRKPIKIPISSSDLAEFIGVMLGDGNIKRNKSQIAIYFNIVTDYPYIKYIQQLIKNIFNIDSSLCRENNSKGAAILVSSRNLVDFLIKKGLKPGNKVANEVYVPSWVFSKPEYKIACLRGLMDTDGSFYSYSHRVNGKIYENYALDFTNRSAPLLQGVKAILEDLEYAPTTVRYKVVLNTRNDINKFATMVSSSNPIRRKRFLSCRYCN